MSCFGNYISCPSKAGLLDRAIIFNLRADQFRMSNAASVPATSADPITVNVILAFGDIYLTPCLMHCEEGRITLTILNLYLGYHQHFKSDQ
jgi:hypothetical protein